MNFIFDFDGTICDSIGATVKTANDILRKLGYKETSVEEVKNIGLIGLVKSQNINDADLNSFVQQYKTAMAEKYSTLIPVNDIPRVLALLHQKHLLGILTTNKVDTVTKFLNQNNISYFKFIRSEENVFDKDKGLQKIFDDYKISASETYFIGDETRDVEAANKVGAKSIAVNWGAESENLLKKSNPFKIVSEASDLVEL